MGKKIVSFSVNHPRLVVILSLLIVLALGIQVRKIKVDTDPENMLPATETVRVIHNQTKKEFTLHDFIILGIVNEQDYDGVFNPETLDRIYTITQQIQKIPGVVSYDLISPSTMDNIVQAGMGSVRFEWLMGHPPKDRQEAIHIRDSARDNPMLNGTLVSEDGKAISLFIPIQQKDMSYRVSRQIRDMVKEYPEKYYITGLPVAEDTFGVEMFRQMAISAPLAIMIIFSLLWFFFKKVSLIVSPMMVAVMSVTAAMGLLIGLGYPVHIMSSMIPIFLLPIAVVDSVHILSEFYDRYPHYNDQRKTITEVMRHLFMPMLYTSLTTAAGFASLAFTPIPPVQTFGMIVAFGVMTAWVLTVTFIPAYTMLIPSGWLRQYGAPSKDKGATPWIEKFTSWQGKVTWRYGKVILAFTGIVLILSVYGITRLNINDNPVKWFSPSHPIRVADRVLNEHFGGTYPAYLVLERDENEQSFNKTTQKILDGIEEELTPEVVTSQDKMNLIQSVRQLQSQYLSLKNYQAALLIQELIKSYDKMIQQAQGQAGQELDSLYAIQDFLEEQKGLGEIFKQPAVLRYIERLQEKLVESHLVGKSTSVTDIAKKIHYELRGGDKTYNRVPDTEAAVAQVLMTYQNSHDPDDLWHMVTPDYRKANIWVQLKSGDNQDMQEVVRLVDNFFHQNPPPYPLELHWAGLTYLNVIWQHKMVYGMLRSLLGSFLIVLVMMVFLYRSPLWGLLAMIPLSVTITFIYGLVGFMGKDYDMPIAILSSLTLGLSVDFAIHFLERARLMYSDFGNWTATHDRMFQEPARAIYRNALVIGIGFVPLLLAPLVPYKTVGFFMCLIMLTSSLVTMMVLPVLVNYLQGILFAAHQKTGCNCPVCLGVTMAAILGTAYFIHQYKMLNWSAITWITAVFALLAVVGCNLMARQKRCQ